MLRTLFSATILAGAFAANAMAQADLVEFEKMLADGIIVEYEIDREMVHTTDSRAQIHFSFVMPNAEALDKFQDALGVAIDQNSLIGPAFASMTVNEHFDFVKVNATFK